MARLVAQIFWSFLAILFLVEAWLWEHVGAALARLVAALPIEPLRVALRALVARLPPFAVLFVFVVPALLLLPLKFVALALVAKGKLVSASAVFLGAKTAGVGVTAFLFDACRARLLEMAWFEQLYRFVLRVRDWAHARIDPYKLRIKAVAAALRERARAQMAKYVGQGAFGRRLAALRKTMRRRIASR